MSQIVIQRIRKGPEDSQRRFLAQVGTGAVPGADSIRALGCVSISWEENEGFGFIKLTYPWNFPLLLTEKTSMTSRDVLKASSKISEFFFCVAQSSCA